MINVDKYLFQGKYREVDLEEYERMIDWVTDHIAPPLQGYSYVHNTNSIGRCGDGWELRLDWPLGYEESKKAKRSVEWHMFIEDDSYAVMFKLMWP